MILKDTFEVSSGKKLGTVIVPGKEIVRVERLVASQ